MELLKTCKNKKCEQINPQLLSNFNKDTTKSDGLQRNCIKCTRQNAKNWAKNNKSHTQQYKSKWDVLYKRESLLRTRYNLTVQDYENMLESQNNCCKICLKHENELSKRLHVDHCHETGKIRGLLCFKCNSALGYFKDNINSIENAIKYLKGVK